MIKWERKEEGAMQQHADILIKAEDVNKPRQPGSPVLKAEAPLQSLTPVLWDSKRRDW